MGLISSSGVEDLNLPIKDSSYEEYSFELAKIISAIILDPNSELEVILAVEDEKAYLIIDSRNGVYRDDMFPTNPIEIGENTLKNRILLKSLFKKLCNYLGKEKIIKGYSINNLKPCDLLHDSLCNLQKLVNAKYIAPNNLQHYEDRLYNDISKINIFRLYMQKYNTCPGLDTSLTIANYIAKRYVEDDYARLKNYFHINYDRKKLLNVYYLSSMDSLNNDTSFNDWLASFDSESFYRDCSVAGNIYLHFKGFATEDLCLFNRKTMDNGNSMLGFSVYDGTKKYIECIDYDKYPNKKFINNVLLNLGISEDEYDRVKYLNSNFLGSNSDGEGRPLIIYKMQDFNESIKDIIEGKDSMYYML